MSTRTNYRMGANEALCEFRTVGPVHAKIPTVPRLLAGLMLVCEEDGASFEAHVSTARMLVQNLPKEPKNG